MALKKASFFIVEDNKTLPVHFNPEEYSIHSAIIKDSNSIIGKDSLSLKLYFDTYMLPSDNIFSISLSSQNRIDVRSYTDPIVKLTEYEIKKSPLVYFKWGSLNFKGRIQTVNQKFTMFLDDGMPVRAVLDITMEGNNDIDVNPVNSKGIDWSNNNWKNNTLIASGIARILLEKS